MRKLQSVGPDTILVCKFLFLITAFPATMDAARVV